MTGDTSTGGIAGTGGDTSTGGIAGTGGDTSTGGIGRLLEPACAQGGLAADDLVEALLPLFRQVAELHADGLVAPLRGTAALRVDEQYRLSLDPAAATPPHTALDLVEAAQQQAPLAVEVTGRARLDLGMGLDPGLGMGLGMGLDLGRGPATGVGDPKTSLDVAVPGEPVTRPVLVGGWQSWEHLLGHHDALCDVAVLGQLLVALGCGLDLADPADVDRLATHRANLFRLNPRLHPVIALLAGDMIEPDRRRRAQDVAWLTERLETYRDQPLDFDLAEVTAGIRVRTDRRRAVLTALRDRLFDLSRRNRLLHFRPTQQSFNLTEASVPLLLDVRNIRPEHLLTWRAPVAKRLLSAAGLPLGTAIRWDDAPYATGALDGLIAQARRDASEYGRAQLRLVVAFLRWHDLKNDPDRRIASPLLLLPVSLTRRRGVRDSYVLRAESAVAEVNPALRQQLRQLYALDLPDTVEVTGDGIAALHADLAARITASEPAVRLSLIERPRIELVRQRALLRVDAFHRRSGRAVRPVGDQVYAYSYRRSGYAPLGLQLFRDRVAYRAAPLGLALGAGPDPAVRHAVHEAATYTLDAGTDGNPYAWDVDLCALTLMNVNYRTMSLVRDYNDLVDDACAGTRGDADDLLDQVFSDRPRPLPPRERPTVPLDDRYLVVPGDASQVAVIARARTGDSFVVQGPPGTGKSQTITNLIADYVARGRRVLFVAQKRAAIDVVHARLRRHGLDELACLIHDSQADKKAFVQGLKATYEGWLAHGDDLDDAVARRAEVVAAIGRELHRIGGYEAALAAAGPSGGPSPRVLLERLVDLHAARWDEGARPRVRRLLPTASAWWAAREDVEAVAAALRRGGWAPVLAAHPARLLAPRVLAAVRPDAEAAALAEDAAAALRDAVTGLARLPQTVLEVRSPAGSGSARSPISARSPRSARSPGGGEWVGGMSFGVARGLAALGTLVLPLAHRGRLSAVRPGSPAAGQLQTDAAASRAGHEALEQTRAAAAGWQSPPGPPEALAALDVARAKETSWTRVFSGNWRQVRRVVQRGYRPAAPAGVAPSVTRTLELLVAAQDAQARLAEVTRAAQEQWGHPDPTALASALTAASRRADPWSVAVLTALGRIEPLPGAGTSTSTGSSTSMGSSTSAGSSTSVGSSTDVVSPAALAELLAAAQAPLDRAAAALAEVVVDVDDLPLTDLLAALDDLADPALASTLRALAPALARLEAWPEVAAALRRLPAEPDQVEYAVAAAALDEVRDQVPALGGFDGRDLAEAVGRVQELLPALYATDAAVIVSRTRSRFLAEAAHSARSVTGMKPAERVAKATWSAGRRELEHEFGKVMRYKSIRDLASEESGAVVAALRPVWLMSPTSVSDTLPLQGALFDVVIYDEASQVPIEEAVPAMCRGAQVVVVGDQMQLPPTSYFTTRGSEPADDEDGEDGEDGDEVGVVLDGDSFLAQSAVRLPSCMLTWHYRSRFEALIRFSNAAFYEGQLSTVPDRTVVRPGQPEILIEAAAQPVPDEQVRAAVDALLSRSISLHRTQGAVYRRRTNSGEAAAIAALVRELLRRETGLTLGVVAFSQAQQAVIEAALEDLADADPDFARRYEAELAREDDNQFLGLFVKNLENVQGDERDVIIISVCYAPDAHGRMAMNFGPINQRGGERRLNVIFSRARRHLAVVSTIEAGQVTNTYNDGAATLRGFLAYAAAVSRGDDAAAETLLTGIGGAAARQLPGGQLPGGAGRSAGSAASSGAAAASGAGRSGGAGGSSGAAASSGGVARRLAAALRSAGVEVAEQVGHSSFRCDLALRRPGNEEHQVGVLIDTTERAAAEQVDERVLSHPAVLRAAGWQVTHVLTKDWYDDPDGVVNGLVAQVLAR